MPTKLSFKLDGRFKKEAVGRIERYEFEVGVLEDGPHKLPYSRTRKEAAKQRRDGKVLGPAASGYLKQFAGGPARKISNKDSGLTIGEVSEHLRKNTGINFYTLPFSGGSKRSREFLDWLEAFMKTVTKGTSADKKRLENSLQAAVRNPILRGEYGTNRPSTAKGKGFNRFMINTGQLFNAIIAKVKKG